MLQNFAAQLPLREGAKMQPTTHFPVPAEKETVPAIPFVVNFEVEADDTAQANGSTNTYGYGDADTATYRRDTEDNDA